MAKNKKDLLAAQIRLIATSEAEYRRLRYHLPPIGDPSRTKLDKQINKILQNLEDFLASKATM